MNKLALCVLIALLFGCKITPDNHTLINNSTYPITYKFRYGLNEETILPGRDAHSDHTSLEYYRPNKRVSLDRSGFIYTFTDFPVYILRVNNDLGQNVNLLGNGWLENDMMNITPGDTQDANHTGTVYSSNPTFTAVTSNGFPARIYFTITGSVMYVNIMWQ